MTIKAFCYQCGEETEWAVDVQLNRVKCDICGGWLPTGYVQLASVGSVPPELRNTGLEDLPDGRSD